MALRIVPGACPWTIVAAVGLERLTVKVLVGAPAGSALTVTVTVCATWPGMKVSIPDVAA